MLPRLSFSSDIREAAIEQPPAPYRWQSKCRLIIHLQPCNPLSLACGKARANNCEKCAIFVAFRIAAMFAFTERGARRLAWLKQGHLLRELLTVHLLHNHFSSNFCNFNICRLWTAAVSLTPLHKHHNRDEQH
jgi:hypothetical protein